MNCIGNGNLDSLGKNSILIVLKLIHSNKESIKYNDLHIEFYFLHIKSLISQAIGKPSCFCLFMNPLLSSTVSLNFCICMFESMLLSNPGFSKHEGRRYRENMPTVSMLWFEGRHPVFSLIFC